MEIRVEKTKTPKEKPDFKNLGFGKYFTDHMFLMDYVEGEGWKDARIVPYGPLELDPSCMVLHLSLIHISSITLSKPRTMNLLRW